MMVWFQCNHCVFGTNSERQARKHETFTAAYNAADVHTCIPEFDTPVTKETTDGDLE